jgi:hypothetical protein
MMHGLTKLKLKNKKIKVSNFVLEYHSTAAG